MINSTQYMALVEKIVLARKEQIPYSESTIENYTERFLKFQGIVDKLREDLTSLANQFIDKNLPTADLINEIEKINLDALNHFSSELDKVREIEKL